MARHVACGAQGLKLSDSDIALIEVVAVAGGNIAPAAAGGLRLAAELGGADQYVHHYYVYYRCAYHGWRLYGCYDCPVQARHVADSLERQGYTTKIEC